MFSSLAFARNHMQIHRWKSIFAPSFEMIIIAKAFLQTRKMKFKYLLESFFVKQSMASVWFWAIIFTPCVCAFFESTLMLSHFRHFGRASSVRACDCLFFHFFTSFLSLHGSLLARANEWMYAFPFVRLGIYWNVWNPTTATKAAKRTKSKI